MADWVDHAISDFVTDKLSAHIEMRRLELSAKTPMENIGGSRVQDNIAPQEKLIFKYDADPELRQLTYRKAMIQLWWNTQSQETRKLMLVKFSNGMTWEQAAGELYIDEKTARRQYQDFKAVVGRYL